MKDLVGKRFAISGMTIEVLSDEGDKYQVRNVTTRDILEMDKAMLDKAIRLGKAESESETGEPE